MEDEITRLASQARDGDRDSFAGLVEIYWNDLVRLSRSIVGGSEAEDVVQEGLMAAWRKIGTLEKPELFKAWALRIVYRRSLRHLRSIRRLVRLTSTMSDPPSNADPAGDFEVWQILSRLAPRQRAVLHLTLIEGMTDSEIGTALGLAPASVRAHRRRARERLATMIRRSDNE